MKASVVLSAASIVGLAAAHGFVTQVTMDGKTYSGYSPFGDPYWNPPVQHIEWTIPGNGPVLDVNSKDIVCNAKSTPGALTAPVTAGSQVKFFWTPWGLSHAGPTMTYLAACTSGDCRKEDPSTLNWFKIDHAGLNPDYTWASETLVNHNSTWTVTIPKELKPGPYLMRHELLALHGAMNVGGAQFYPDCFNIDVKGSGTGVPDKTVKFPGAYKPKDPGVLIDIYWPKVTSYVIPGPDLVTLVSGGENKPPVTSTVISTTTTVPTAPVGQKTSSPSTTADYVPYEPDHTSTLAPQVATPSPTPTPAPVPRCPRRKAKRVAREALKKRNARS